MARSGSKAFLPHKEHSWIPITVVSRDEEKVSYEYDVLEDDLDSILCGDDLFRNANDERGEALTVTLKEVVKLMKAIGAKIDMEGHAFDLPLRDDGALMDDGVADMTTLNYLHEASILYNLRTRFFKKHPYTYTGDICIAVNPYQWLDLYKEETMNEYFVFRRTELPPHVYATSASAFTQIQDGGQNQSVLVSGESGAGKTETVKILMGHIAYISAGDDHTVIKRILESNPLLESFGNAKTVRNDNSSRFGKFTELQFEGSSRLIGSMSRTYLLEKSRVIFQNPGERNFHIFHQLLSSEQTHNHSNHQHDHDKAHEHTSHDNMDMFASLVNFLATSPHKPASADDTSVDMSLALLKVPWTYVADHSETQLIEGKSDAARLAMTVGALSLIGQSREAIEGIFVVILAILYIGQIRFEPVDGDDEKSQVCAGDASISESVDRICTLLGLKRADLELAFTERTMRARDDVYKVPLRPPDALAAAGSVAKEIYSRLFDHVVLTINESTAAESSTVHKTIALLDIFGFEHFKVNSFEQLCINWANEKLQQKFTHDVFKTVQAEYQAEGIGWSSIDFKDNKETLELIEARMGIISVLTEECRRPKGNDEAFVSKLATLHEKHKDFSQPKLDANRLFTVSHYAGAVTYTADGFLEKNKDTVPEDLITTMASSAHPVVSMLFQPQAPTSPSAADSTASSSRGKGKASKKGMLMAETVSTKFKTQLGELMSIIAATNVQYVRCIKPNKAKSNAMFTMDMVVDQLRCAGVIEAIRISRAGYPHKLKHGEFIERFRVLAPVKRSELEEMLAGSKGAKACEVVLVGFLGAGRENEFAIGATRVYFKHGLLEVLEVARNGALERTAVLIQKVYRRFFMRARFTKGRACIVCLQGFLRKRAQQRRYKLALRRITTIQSLHRRNTAAHEVHQVRLYVRARTIQASYRMSVQRRSFVRQSKAATHMQKWIRMELQRAAYKILLHEAKEQAKMENQLIALQKKFEEEAKARQEMEERNRALLERLKDGSSSATPQMVQDGNAQGQPVISENSTIVDKSVLDESQKMLQLLQKENARVKQTNVKLQQEITRLEREATQVRNAADHAEATMKVLSQHSKTLAQTHMKLQTAKERADAEVAKLNKKVGRLTEELQMKQAMYIAEVNARVQDGKTLERVTKVVEEDESASNELREKIQRLCEMAVAAGMAEDEMQPVGRNRSQSTLRRMSVWAFGN